MRLERPEVGPFGEFLAREVLPVGMDQLINELMATMEQLEPARPGPMTREQYRRVYLVSPAWRATRALAIERAGRRCADCGLRDEEKHLDVHHLTYVRLGAELLSDLVVVCRSCHDARHSRRERQIA